MKRVIQADCLNCGKEIPRKPNIYCSMDCRAKHMYSKSVKQWLAGEHPGHYGDQVADFVRRYIFKKYNSRCTKCGWHEINPTTGKIPLTIEHKDGNSQNTIESNLDLLCPNCHSLTSTYGALNKGNGRQERQSKRMRV